MSETTNTTNAAREAGQTIEDNRQWYFVNRKGQAKGVRFWAYDRAMALDIAVSCYGINNFNLRRD